MTKKNIRSRFVCRAAAGLIGALVLVGCSAPTTGETPALVSTPVATVVEQASEEDQQIAGDVAATVEAAIALAVEATIAARDAGVPPAEQDSAAAANTPTAEAVEAEVVEAEVVEAEVVEAAAESEEHDAMAEVPVLFTPTPDQSVAIAQFVNANTRHFEGSADAKVVLIEFSDFW